MVTILYCYCFRVFCVSRARNTRGIHETGITSGTGERNGKRRRRHRDTMGCDGTIVLAAAGAAATTMHNDGLSARCYCRAPQTVSSRRTAENQRARVNDRLPRPSRLANGFSRSRKPRGS